MSYSSGSSSSSSSSPGAQQPSSRLPISIAGPNAHEILEELVRRKEHELKKDKTRELTQKYKMEQLSAKLAGGIGMSIGDDGGSTNSGKTASKPEDYVPDDADVRELCKEELNGFLNKLKYLVDMKTIGKENKEMKKMNFVIIDLPNQLGEWSSECRKSNKEAMEKQTPGGGKNDGQNQQQNSNFSGAAQELKEAGLEIFGGVKDFSANLFGGDGVTNVKNVFENVKNIDVRNLKNLKNTMTSAVTKVSGAVLGSGQSSEGTDSFAFGEKKLKAFEEIYESVLTFCHVGLIFLEDKDDVKALFSKYLPTGNTGGKCLVGKNCNFIADLADKNNTTNKFPASYFLPKWDAKAVSKRETERMKLIKELSSVSSDNSGANLNLTPIGLVNHDNFLLEDLASPSVLTLNGKKISNPVRKKKPNSTRFFYNPTQKIDFLVHFKGFFDFF